MAAISDKALLKATTNDKFNAGNELEDDISFYNTFYRKYDAQMGRFIGIDPKAESSIGQNPFQYGNNNPISFNDPMGDLTSAEFQQILNTLWNSPFGGTWSSNNGGGGGGGFGGGSSVYLFSNNTTAIFYGGLAANGINYTFGTDGNLRVGGMFVTSINNVRRNGVSGVSIGGYFENKGEKGQGSTLDGVTMGGYFFKNSIFGFNNNSNNLTENAGNEEGNKIYTQLETGLTAMDIGAMKTIETGFEYAAAGSKFSSAKYFLKGAKTVGKISTGIGVLGVGLAIMDGNSNGWQIHSKIDMVVGVASLAFPVFGLIYGVLDLGVQAFSDDHKSISEHLENKINNLTFEVGASDNLLQPNSQFQ